MAIPFASQHSPSFPQLLAQLGASLVVSTYQAGQLIFLRNQNGMLNTHFCPLEKPMGVAGNHERLTVGTAFQIREYANLPAVARNIPGEFTHDGCYLPRQVHVTGDIDIHEMAYAQDEQLWFVNTRMSCLCTLERRQSVVPRWRPPFVSAYDLTDRCHLNGRPGRDARSGRTGPGGLADAGAVRLAGMAGLAARQTPVVLNTKRAAKKLPFLIAPAGNETVSQCYRLSNAT